MRDTDLRLWDILYVWHRSGVLRYSSRRHRLETLRYSVYVTQTWDSENVHATQTYDSEIFFTVDTALGIWDFHQMVTQIPRTEIFNTEDTDLKIWDIQHDEHRSQDLRYSAHLTQISSSEIFYARHKTQALRYSIRQTQISRPEIFHTEDKEQKKWTFSMADTDLVFWYVLRMRHRLETLRYSIVWHRSGVLRYS